MASERCCVCGLRVASGVGNPADQGVILGCPVPFRPKYMWYYCEQCREDASYCADHAGDHEHAVVLGPRHSALVTCPLCAHNNEHSDEESDDEDENDNDDDDDDDEDD